jgi:hypothetical protein
VDEAPHVEYLGGQLVEKWIDGNAFLGEEASPVLASGYWTSSAYPGPPPGSAYTVNFHTGYPSAVDMSQTQYVRCVH